MKAGFHIFICAGDARSSEASERQTISEGIWRSISETEGTTLWTYTSDGPPQSFQKYIRRRILRIHSEEVAYCWWKFYESNSLDGNISFDVIPKCSPSVLSFAGGFEIVQTSRLIICLLALNAIIAVFADTQHDFSMEPRHHQSISSAVVESRVSICEIIF